METLELWSARSDFGSRRMAIVPSVGEVVVVALCGDTCGDELDRLRVARVVDCESEGDYIGLRVCLGERNEWVPMTSVLGVLELPDRCPDWLVNRPGGRPLPVEGTAIAG